MWIEKGGKGQKEREICRKVGNETFMHMGVMKEWDKLVQFCQHRRKPALPAEATTERTQQELRGVGVSPRFLSLSTVQYLALSLSYLV